MKGVGFREEETQLSDIQPEVHLLINKQESFFAITESTYFTSSLIVRLIGTGKISHIPFFYEHLKNAYELRDFHKTIISKGDYNSKDKLSLTIRIW